MRSRALSLGLAILALAALAALALGPGWERAVTWAMEQQRLFHRDLAGHLRDLAAGQSLAAWALVAVSFAYGVLHAVGPGHGKVVIAAYLATHHSRLARGVVLGIAASLCQGVVAVVLVDGLMALAGWLPADRQAAVNWSERLSFALVMLMGGLFAVRAALRLAASLRPRAVAGGHAHHVHDAECGCGHVPSAEQMRQAEGWRPTVGVLLSIGLRPCSGAVLVLVFANALDFALAGIASVFAMAAGTAVTVSVLAVAVVKARGLVVRLFGRAAGGQAWMGAVVALLGGGAIFLFGASLLAASFGPAHPLRL